MIPVFVPAGTIIPLWRHILMIIGISSVAKPCSSISTKSQPRSLQVSIKPAGMAPKFSKSRAISSSCRCRRAPPNSTPRKTSGRPYVRCRCVCGSSTLSATALHQDHIQTRTLTGPSSERRPIDAVSIHDKIRQPVLAFVRGATSQHSSPSPPPPPPPPPPPAQCLP